MSKAKVSKKKTAKKSAKKSLATRVKKSTKKKVTVRKKPVVRQSPKKVKKIAKKTTKKRGKKYKIGDYLVYPMHGIGLITAISKQKILDVTKRCYVMELQNNKMRVIIPVDKADGIGIRSIISKREIRKVINLLKEDKVDTEEDWKIRYQKNMDKIKSGNIYSVAEVCRNLYKRARDKELSLMERRLYESAYRLVSSEIALTTKISMQEAGNVISEVLT